MVSLIRIGFDCRESLRDPLRQPLLPRRLLKRLKRQPLPLHRRPQRLLPLLLRRQHR